MDINDWRGVAVITCMVAFAVVVIWAYSKRNKPSFDEAANLPFADDDNEQPTKRDRAE